MGAWIEIWITEPVFHMHFVAPLVGAWIEISGTNPQNHQVASLPSWERGLKSGMVIEKAVFVIIVAPLVGAWIEISDFAREKYSEMSLPSWERGLKSASRTDWMITNPGRSPRGSVD